MLSEPRSYSEKRGFIRMAVEAPIAIRCDGRELEAVCHNLSGSGLLVEAERELAPGSVVEVEIAQEGDNRIPFRATAEVNRVQATETGQFAIGLAIRNIHD